MGFQQGLSGLNAASKNLDVIGHNIANSGTVGFKASRTEFANMVASAMGMAQGNNNGIGVQVDAIAQQFTQGGITLTGNSLDVAINGNGFFQIQQPDGSMAYSRAGNFKLDKDGNVLTNNNGRLMGYPVDPVSGKALTGAVQPLNFPLGTPIAAKETTEAKISLNLDARTKDAAGDPTATPPVPATPRSTYGTSINVFDSQGVATPANFYFEKNGSNTWDIYDGINDPKANPAVFHPLVGQVEMDGNGNIVGLSQPLDFDATTGNPNKLLRTVRRPDGTFGSEEISLTWTPLNQDPADPARVTGYTLAPFTKESDPSNLADAAPFDFKLNMTVKTSSANPNDPPKEINFDLDLSNITQFGTKFAVSETTQDGYTSGQLTGMNIGPDGTITTTYSNGVSRPEGVIALATFRNTQGLADVGNNLWVETASSGQPTVGQPTSGAFGELRAGALEESNVDLTAELVNMMTAQRAYQANAQTIKTQDQVMSTIVNLR